MAYLFQYFSQCSRSLKKWCFVGLLSADLFFPQLTFKPIPFTHKTSLQLWNLAGLVVLPPM